MARRIEDDAFSIVYREACDIRKKKEMIGLRLDKKNAKL